MSEYHELSTLDLYERKEYEELKHAVRYDAKRRSDRNVFLGFLVTAVVSTLIISGALKVDLSVIGF